MAMATDILQGRRIGAWENGGRGQALGKRSVAGATV